MAKANYTITESIEALGVDPKTFRRWLEKASIDPEKQKSAIDERMRYLTEPQLRSLAEAHGRPWPPQPRAPKDTLPTTPGALKQLVTDLVGHQVNPLEQEQGEQAEQIQGHSSLLAEALGRIDRLEQATRAASETLATLQEHMTELERQTQNQAAQIASLVEQIRAMSQPRAARRQRSEAADHASIAELPPGLVGAAEFAIEHGINTGTAKSAFQSGRVPTRHGKWRGGRNPITVALDSEGRRVFWQIYHGSGSFQACQDCPHASD